MILIIVSTNRKNSMSAKIADYYQNVLTNLEEESQILNLENLPHDFAFSALYENSGKNSAFQPFQALVDSVQKIVFVVPEYNGSFPGVLKTFIDALRFPDTFIGKKMALVGVASGVQGAAMGLSHLSDILAYRQANVLGLRVQLGLINQYFDGTTFSHEIYKKMIDNQAKLLVAF